MSEFFNRVEHRFTGKDHGVFRVPTRTDRNMSGTFRITDDGRLLIFDHGGDSAAEILAALGLELRDLFPEPITTHSGRSHRPFPASDALRVIADDALIVAAAAVTITEGNQITEDDRARLIDAAARIRGTLDACGLGGRHARS